MADSAGPGVGKLAAWVLLLFIVGTPLVAYLWETLNHLLSGRFEPVQLLIALPVAAVLWLVLRTMGRLIVQWTGGPPELSASHRTGNVER
jgi:hypothetical protein